MRGATDKTAEARPDFGELVPVAYLGTTVHAFADRPLSLSQALRDAAGRWPDRPAVCTPEARLSYREFDAVVDAMAAGLALGGAAEGDTVAVALSHGLRAHAVTFATSRLGARALLLPAGRPPEAWREQLARVPTVLAVGEGRLCQQLRLAAGRLPVCDVGEALPLTASSSPPEAQPDEDRPIALIGTSGTTGVPKTSAVTSRGLIHAALGYAELLDLNPDDRSLVVLPLSYIGPLSAQTTAMVLVGGCAILPRRTGAAGALEALATHGITHLDAVPAWLTQISHSEFVPALPAWRSLIYGGAPMPAQTAARLARAFPGLQMWDVWGLSETHGPATAIRYDAADPAPPGTVGTPLPGVEVRAVDEGGAALEPGTIGELVVRGANVTTGYVDDPDTTRAVLRGGWLHSGDMGTVGADGTVRVLDRRKDVISRGGNSVFSVEVEQVLCAAPGVVEAAVYGIPDGLGGEAVAATVVLADGRALDVKGLRRLVAERLGRHAVPRRIATVAALPRNQTGKIDKRQLRSATP